MDFELSEELLALQESVRRLAQDKVKPRAREIDESNEYPEDLFELFRDAVGTYVYVGANGGYCSPRHARIGGASPHCWGTAANIYRVGDTYLDDHDSIARYAAIAREVLPTVWTRPLGPQSMKTDDHLHLDLGYVISVPREAAGETYNVKLAGDPL